MTFQSNSKYSKLLSKQSTFFVVSMACFIVMAALGWEKLPYGFNFSDEGYHATEAWRITVGDNVFREGFTGALNLSHLINSIFFRLMPEITHLGLRQLQYVSAISSLLFFSFALFRLDKQYWYQPLIFSVFAFTGLDPVGMISHLYYHTYVNLFITLHLSFFLIGIIEKSTVIRRAFFVISGFFLWCISFNLLYSSVVVISPVLTFYILKKIKTDTIKFDFRELMCVLIPFVVCWAIFIGIFNKLYIVNVYNSLQLMLSSSVYSFEEQNRFNWEALKHIGVIFLYFSVFLYILKIKTKYLIPMLILLMIGMYYVIDTSFWGLITPYYNGWFSRPMWFTALVISFMAILPLYFLLMRYQHRTLSDWEAIIIIMIIPCALLSISNSRFSGLGILTVLHTSIPIIGAMSLFVIRNRNIIMRSYFTKLAILTMLFLPFYYSVAWSDWKFTFFDVAPDQEDVVIDQGYGKGIKTNQLYKGLYNWISRTSDKFSSKDDYIIAYVQSSMVHMISKRRPSFEDSFITFGLFPESYYEKMVNSMKQRHREPQLAFVFESVPGLVPLSLKEPQYAFYDKQFSFSANDPISKYVSENMYFLDQFRWRDDVFVKCFTRSKSDAEKMRLSRDYYQ